MPINRQQLIELIESDGGNNWWKPELFESEIRHLLPPELKIVSNPPSYEQNYNCFAYAFCLHAYPEFLGGNDPVQQEFVKWLILSNSLKMIENPVEGSLIFYENENGDITHGGVMQDKDTVISKWMWGPTIVHKILDVPSSFGDKISFYINPGAEEIRKLYEIYKSTGVEIKPIS